MILIAHKGTKSINLTFNDRAAYARAAAIVESKGYTVLNRPEFPLESDLVWQYRRAITFAAMYTLMRNSVNAARSMRESTFVYEAMSASGRAEVEEWKRARSA